MQPNNALTVQTADSEYLSLALNNITGTLFEAAERNIAGAMRLLTEIELTYINAVQMEFYASNEARGKGDTKATKPADIWRKYSADLRAIKQRGRAITALHAEKLLQDIYCEQSLSENDLANPEYLDPYTREPVYETLEEFCRAIPDRHEHDTTDRDAIVRELARFVDMAPELMTGNETTTISDSHKEVLNWSIRLRDELGYDEETAAKFMETQMDGWDAESDEEPEVYDDIDPYTPPTLIPNDLVLDRELWYSAREAMFHFNQARSRVFDEMKKATQEKDRKKRLYVRKGQWHPIFRSRFEQTEEFAKMIDTLNEVAREDIVTAATIYLTMAGDYGLMEKDVQHIRGLYQLPEQFYKPESISPGAYMPLLSFANEWEDDLLNLSQDAMSPTPETNPHSYQDVLMDVITTDENGDIKINPAPIRAVMPQYSHNPLETASWNIGFARAATAKTTWKEAEEAGWAAFRKEMSADAAAEYDRVYRETKDRKKAMAAFWRVCPREVPRPQDHIHLIKADRSGLILTNKREITWNIVRMKIQNDELFLTPDIRKRLLVKLRELRCGQQIWSLLQ
jgi:hypothetical protein